MRARLAGLGRAIVGRVRAVANRLRGRGAPAAGGGGGGGGEGR